MNYSNGRSLLLYYNNRMFLTQWNVPGVLGYEYRYDYYGENNTGRVVFAQNLYNGGSPDGTLDRSWYYDDMGRLGVTYTGSEARATIGTDTWGHPDGPYAQRYDYDVYGNRTHEEGWGGIYGSYTNTNPTYTSNRRDGPTYDLAGNITASGTASYDATGQQVAYTYAGMSHVYDGDRLRGKRNDNGNITYYVRSTVLGGQVVCEINGSGTWMKGYVYLGGQLIALQDNGVWWVHQEPYTKGQRFTNSVGAIAGNIVELDPWGGNTSRSQYSSFQPHLFTSYERDSDGGDDAMNRRYSPIWSRFSQPDPYNGSYQASNPQSFNRYAYVNNDPVNFADPSGLMMALTCLVDGVPSSSCTAAFGLVASGAGVIYGGTGWYGDGDIFVIDHFNMVDRAGGLNTWQSIFLNLQDRWTFSDDQRGMLDRALNIAIDALRKPECAGFVAGISDDPIKQLTGLERNTGQKGKGFINMSDVRPRSGNLETIAEAVRVMGFGFGSGPAVALYGAFFDNRREFGLNADQTRALTLIHELGHVTRSYFHSAIPDAFGLGKNMSDPEVNRAIYNKCFASAPPRGVT